MKKKYQVLIDYGAYEGMKFWDDGYDDFDEAVKAGTENSYGSKFYIVEIINWVAKKSNSKGEI